MGMFFAIIIAKQLFGGLGHNIFNPAMVGYAVILIAFPQYLVVWPAWSVDAITSATPLDVIQAQVPYTGFFILSAFWMFGGLGLLYKRIITWHIPAGVLMGIAIFAFALFPFQSQTQIIPLAQLGLGASMIGAFFIATDPVSAPANQRARFIYGLLIGMLIILMRYYSNFPDGVAFAVLLANICSPMLNTLTQGRKQ